MLRDELKIDNTHITVQEQQSTLWFFIPNRILIGNSMPILEVYHRSTSLDATGKLVFCKPDVAFESQESKSTFRRPVWTNHCGTQKNIAFCFS
jgi:hypothetical protein